MNDNDVVLLYVIKNGSNKCGFLGYVRVSDKLKENKDKNGKIRHGLTDDQTFNKYITSIKSIKLFEKRIGRSVVFKEEEDNKKFGLRVNSHKPIVEILEGLGKCAHDFLKHYDESIEIKKKPEKIKKEIPIIKSKYIIPILVIPCKEFIDDIQKVDVEDKIQWIFDHIMFCRRCEINNNNDRVSLDMICCGIVSYKKFKSKEEIKPLVKKYHSLDYYETTELEENNTTVIKIFHKKYVYDNCYFLISKLDREY